MLLTFVPTPIFWPFMVNTHLFFVMLMLAPFATATGNETNSLDSR
jgi:hypothetical protein